MVLTFTNKPDKPPNIYTVRPQPMYWSWNISLS